MDFNESDKKRLHDLGIAGVILFGSRAQGIASDASDYDIFVIGAHNKLVYDTLYDMIAGKIGKLVNIDIVFEDTAPMELQHHVARYGRVFYESNASVFADFRQRVMTEYADFAPHRAINSDATLSRISL